MERCLRQRLLKKKKKKKVAFELCMQGGQPVWFVAFCIAAFCRNGTSFLEQLSNVAGKTELL